MKKALFILSTALIVLSSCNKNLIEDRNEDGGYILFQVASNDAMSTKAAVSEQTLATYTITIRENNAEGNVKVSQALSAFGNKLYSVATGTYHVAMENISQAASVEGNGAKRIAGATTVNVSAGNTATATIAGAVVNAATKVVFDESFTSTFKDFSVVLDKTGRNLSTSVSETVMYWNPGTVAFDISAKLKADESTVSGSGSVQLNAKDLKTLTFKAGQNGKILLTISADDSMNEGGEEIVIDPYTGLQ